jgi:predicted HTH transcriptional regulator
MPFTKCIAPTIEMIQTRQIGEGQNYEFKGSLALSDRKAKSDFINDVVAFLNAGPGRPGHLIVGVHEKKGAFERFEPISGDPDAICRQFTSTIQDNIDPKPLGVAVSPLDVNNGFIIDVGMQEHRRRPYQNRINGAFYLRTGAKNTPIPPYPARSSARYVHN